MTKNPEPQTAPRSATLARQAIRKPRTNADARALARIRTAAAIVRHRQEALYDRLADRFRRAFEMGEDKGRAGMDDAAESARRDLTAAGALTKPLGERLKGLLLRDLDRTAAEFAPLRNGATEKLQRAEPESGALASLAIVLETAGEATREIALEADESLAYRTGEVTSAGTLTCVKCATVLRFKGTGTVPPCPTCSLTEFRKAYP
ncbi:MAG TPA: hypothetical protein PK042_04965 [Usitatibacteraceae bacterium]|nr:hypothetical protein [Usitatibacteraceae bacterium]